MAETITSIYVPIPKPKTYNWSITANEEDVTSRVLKSVWKKPLLNNGIGTFSCELINTGNILKNKISKGDTITFKGDLSDGSTTQFIGRIDYPRNVRSKDGQFLILEGRHISWFLNERRVCYQAEDEDVIDILKAICDSDATELVQSSLPASIGITTSVNWEYTPFTECVRDLMITAGYDSYISDTLIIYFFEKGTIENQEEAINENDNVINMPEQGQDDFYEKTRVTVMGEDDDGNPIVYTAINGKDDNETQSTRESEGIREIFRKETSANTPIKVKELAVALLSEHTNRASQGTWETAGLVTIKPGDKIWVAAPRIDIFEQQRVQQVTHEIGIKVGMWKTKLQMQELTNETDDLIIQSYEQTKRTTKIRNINKLKYSFNETFDNETYTSTKTRVLIKDGVLKLTGENTESGTWESTSQTSTADTITQLELRFKGKDLGASKFYYSCNNGATYAQFTGKEILTTSQIAGRKLKLKIELFSDTLNPQPEVDSVAVLYN